MIKLINRDLALVKYRNFPLLAYDETLDEDIFLLPEIYWFLLDKVER